MDYSSQESIKELTCPICRELLTEPISLDCGHSFCQACITAHNESGSYQGLECCCPVCQSSYQPWNLQFNWQLDETVKKFKESMKSHQWQRRDLCEHHGEIEYIFSEEDGKAICRLCVQEHQGYEMPPMEEGVKECQEALEKLTQEQQEAEKLEADINEERDAWKNRMQAEREKILKGFKEMRDILDREEQRELQKLEEDQMNLMDNLTVAKGQVAQQKQYLSELVSDLQRHLYESSVDMLQDTINFIRRSEVWTLKKPKIVSKRLKSSFQVPDLSGMLQNFKELTEVQSYWVDLMLNPLSAADQRQVTVGQDFMFRNVYPWNISAFDVLGSQHFSSRKYYWEVDVSGKKAWILGACSNISDLNRKESSEFVLNSNVNYSNGYSRFRPQNGYWVVGLQNESEYIAFEDSSTSDPKVLILAMAVPPHQVGIFLDSETGTVSFFNVTNHGSLIYKFSNCHFSQTAYPYFNPWNCPVPMTLCSPDS